MKNYYDIEMWAESPTKFMDFLRNRDKYEKGVHKFEVVDVNIVKLYALLKSKVSREPNGFYSSMNYGYPIDGIIWWDFVLESDIGFIHMWRTAALLEVRYYTEIPDFNFHKFIFRNFDEYKQDINREIAGFEKHSVYINHFKSYSDCVKNLWNDIQSIDLEPPEKFTGHVIEESEVTVYQEHINRFHDNSVRFHVLGKSLVLHAAFKIEAFVNFIIRIGAYNELKQFPEVFKNQMNTAFKYKITNLRFLSHLLSNDIDLENPIIRNTLELMTIRNKYVHSDESSKYNKIGEVYFDRNYPLFEVTGCSAIVDSIKNVFHRPDYNIVTKAYKTSNDFVDYVISLMRVDMKETFLRVIDVNPIGFNEVKQIYSIISSQVNSDFLLARQSNSSDENEEIVNG